MIPEWDGVYGLPKVARQRLPLPSRERVGERGKAKPPVVDRQLVTFFCFAKRK